jgi:hypothetical protein
MSKSQGIKIIFILLIVADLVFSFFQYYGTPLFGDIESGVLPDKYVQQIIDDPFGFRMLKTGEKHVNPNRFFSHVMFMEYFRHMPIWLQKFSNPISSVYLSAAFIKIVIQILFILMIAGFVSKTGKIFSEKFLLSAILITPLFQSYGFWSRMGINDKSIAYTFFYAVPLIFLMLFLFLVFHSLQPKNKFSWRKFLYLSPFIIVLPFSGPLVPGVILIVTLLAVIQFIIKNHHNIIGTSSFFRTFPILFYLILLPICLLSIYSLFLGLFDLNYSNETLSLGERFLRLPAGLYSQVFHSLGFPLMLITILVNYFILKKFQTEESKKLIQILLWITIFSLLYILLLPFGGYRPYRENIIRYDTFMPVNTALFYYFTASGYFIIKYLEGKKREKYVLLIAIVLLIFSIADIKGLNKNKCEKAALQKMSKTNEKIVALPNNCYVLSWENIYDYQQSENKAELIFLWRITSEKKLFYNEY